MTKNIIAIILLIPAVAIAQVIVGPYGVQPGPFQLPIGLVTSTTTTTTTAASTNGTATTTAAPTTGTNSPIYPLYPNGGGYPYNGGYGSGIYPIGGYGGYGGYPYGYGSYYPYPYYG